MPRSTRLLALLAAAALGYAPAVAAQSDPDTSPLAPPSGTGTGTGTATGSSAPDLAPVGTSAPPAASDGATSVDPAAAPSGFAPAPLVDVELDPALPDEDPFARVGLTRGVLLDAPRARTALLTALASGTYAEASATVRPAANGWVLVIRGERRVSVREVAFGGVAGRSLESVRTDFGVTANSRVGEQDVARAALRLTQSYRDAGWDAARVTWSWRATDDPATRVLIVRIVEGPATTVRRVVLVGVPRELNELALDAVGIHGGDVADPQAARRAFDPLGDALRRAGYLGAVVLQVRYVPVGGARADAHVVVRAGPRYRIDWAGVRLFPRSVLTAALKVEEERGLDATALAAMVARVRDFYVRRGFLDARVRAEVQALTPERAVLRFTVTEGTQVFVERVDFPGARTISGHTLRDVLTNTLTDELPGAELLQDPRGQIEDLFDDAPGFSGARPWAPRVRLRPEHTYAPDLYTEAARRMVTRYREAGFLDAQVAAPEVRRIRGEFGGPALAVRFRVEEGPRTLFDDVAFEGNSALASRELVEETSLRLGVPLSYAALDEARTQIAEHYREQGYLFARVEPAVDRSPDRTHARVRFVVHEGPRVRVGQIVLRGNERTQDGIIRERVALQPGEIYRSSLVRTTQRRLGELGIFTGVTITPVDADVEAPVKDVAVHVLEVRPQFLELRGGLSTGEGLRAGLNYGYRNLAGTGITTTLSLQAGYQVFAPLIDTTYAQYLYQLPLLRQLRYRATLSFLFPVIPGLGPNARATLDGSLAQIIERQFVLQSNTASASLIVRPSRTFSVTTTPEIANYGLVLLGAQDINQVLEDAQTMRPGDVERLRRLLLLPQGTTDLASARVTAVLDLRDQIFNPHRGLFASATAEYVQTLRYDGGASAADNGPIPGNTVRGFGTLSAYFQLPVADIVFATSLRGGINVGVNPRPPPAGHRYVTFTNRQYFLGGTESMRGWLQDTFIPEDAIEPLKQQLNTCANDPMTMSLAQCQTYLIDTQRGGDAFVSWRNEFRIPITTIASIPVALGIFLDVGNLWQNLANVNLLRLRADAGPGIRFITPIGPVAFDLGINLAPQCFLRDPANPGKCAGGPYRESDLVLQFSIGTF